MLVLGPTKELVDQIGRVAKSLSHAAKFSSASLTSAGGKGDQKRALGAPLDVVFATPTRLLQHNEEGSVHLGDVRWVVVDEADTMVLKARGAPRGGCGKGYKGGGPHEPGSVFGGRSAPLTPRPVPPPRPTPAPPGL
jgi:hypothetical protein